jgi:hypothetical protein
LNKGSESEQPTRPVDLRDDGVDIDLLSCEEIERALKYLKNNKAAGADSIAAELLKNGGLNLVDALDEVIQQAWTSEILPEYYLIEAGPNWYCVQCTRRAINLIVKTIEGSHLSRQTKFTIHKTLIRPVLLIGSETWVLTKREEIQLLVFERKVLQTICGQKNENGVYRQSYNHELDKEFDSPNALNVTKTSRLRYAGHMLRRPEDLPQKVLIITCNFSKSRKLHKRSS